MGNGPGNSGGRNRHGLTGKRAAAHATLNAAEKRAYTRHRKNGASHATAMKRVGANPFTGKATTKEVSRRVRGLPGARGSRTVPVAPAGASPRAQKAAETQRVAANQARRSANIAAREARNAAATKTVARKATAKTATTAKNTTKSTAKKAVRRVKKTT